MLRKRGKNTHVILEGNDLLYIYMSVQLVLIIPATFSCCKL